MEPGEYTLARVDGGEDTITGRCAGCGLSVSLTEPLVVASRPLGIPTFDGSAPLYSAPKRFGVWHAACAPVRVPFGRDVTYSDMVWRVLNYPTPNLAPLNVPLTD